MTTWSKYNLITRTYFKDIYDDPYTLTRGQEQIFAAIYEKKYPRVVIKATTQYGKSDITSMALIIAMMERKEKVLIVAPSSKQANLIMSYFIGHLFDHPLLTAQIQGGGTKLEKLKEERSKKRITFINGSEIQIITAEARNISGKGMGKGMGLMGFGASIVVIDESSLIPDVIFGKILRMVGGMKKGGKIIQLGNPWEENHFGKAFHSKRYVKISIDYHQALQEGRLQPDYVEEQKETLGEDSIEFKVLYECKFPTYGLDNQVIPSSWIINAVNQDVGGDTHQSALDVARFGNDKSVYMRRKGGALIEMQVTDKMDTMEVVGWVRPFIEKENPDKLGVDVVGLGAGVYDRLVELYEEDKFTTELVEINFGAGPTDSEKKDQFVNLRAEVYWHLRKLFQPDKNGRSLISIPDDEGLQKELRSILYSYSSEKKIKLEPKEDVKRRVGKSPDKADTLAMLMFDYSKFEAEMFIV